MIMANLDMSNATNLAVGDKSKASKFTLDTAEWKSKKLTDSNGYGQVIFYPEEI